MARKKKSHKLHLLDGTNRGGGKLKSLPAPATKIWRCPSWLGPEGRSFHKRYFPICESMGTVTEADRARWFNLCQRWQRIREAEAAIDAHGLVVSGRQSEIKRNPACAILKAEQDIFRRECDCFGLGHEPRTKMGLRVNTGKKSRMEELID